MCDKLRARLKKGYNMWCRSGTYISTRSSQRTEDQWPMTSRLVHVARARVHVTTRVTTRASELLHACIRIYTYVYRSSKISCIRNAFILTNFFFSQATWGVIISPSNSYVSLSFSIFFSRPFSYVIHQEKRFSRNS